MHEVKMPAAGTQAQEDRHRIVAASASLLVSVSLLIVKFWAYNLTHSQAVYSDAVESVVNVVAASLALFVILFSSKPADREHPYGHGKIEYFSAAFEGGLITFAALLIAFEAIAAWFEGGHLERLDYGLVILLAAGIGNLALGLYLLYIGKSYGSTALRASGHHVISDFWTSFAVVAGLLLLRFTSWPWVDPMLAILVGIHLAFTGYQLVRYSVGGLLDEEDPQVLREVSQVFRRNVLPGLIQFHHTRVIRSGRYHHIDVHVVVPEFWDVAKAHAVMDEFERRAIADYPHDGELHAHMDPCRRAYCRVCDLPECPVRQHAFEGRTALTLDELTDPEEPQDFQ